MKKEHDGKRKVFLRMVMFVCIAVFVHPLSASADVIFEPENNFYERHSDECSYFDRSCLAGADTYLWDAPNLTTEGGKLQKGDSIYISFVYTDNDGLELARETVCGPYDSLFSMVVCEDAGKTIADSEIFSTYFKAHIDRGAKELEKEFRYDKRLFRRLIGLKDSI